MLKWNLSVKLSLDLELKLPEVSAESPCINWNILPQALATAAILAMTGRL